MNQEKRKLLKGIALAAGYSGLCGASDTRFSLARAHDQAIGAINGLEKKPSTLSILIPEGCEPNLAPVIERFTSGTGIAVKQDIAPVDDINTKLMLAVTSESRDYDIALPATFGLPDLVSAQAILNLDAYAERYQPRGFQDDALYTLGDYHFGNLYGYQADGDTYLMFYNRPWLEDPGAQSRYQDRYGKRLAIPATWEELDRQMAFFHAPDQGRYGGNLFRTPDYMVWEWWIRFHAKGYYPLGGNLEPQIANDAGVEALEELVAASRHQAPGSDTDGLFDNWRRYAQGNSYCNIGWGGTQKYLNGPESAVRGKLAYSPAPGGVVNGQLLRVPYFNWGWNYTVARSSRHPEVAYLFTLFASSPEISTLSVRENGYFDPFRRAHYRDARIREIYSDDFLTAHAQSMSQSIPDFYISGQGQYMNTLREYIYRAKTGRMSARAALTSAAKIWRRLHRQFNLDNQLKQWRFIKSKYPRVLRDVLK